VVPAPIHVLHVSTGSAAAPTVSHPRTLIVVRRGAQATLVETYGGAKGDVYFTNAVTEVCVEDGAILEHVRMQRESDSASHVATLAVRQERDAHYANRNVVVGGALSRLDLDCVLGGDGCDLTLDGLFLADGTQHLDTHTRIEHAHPHGTSRELYKGILDGRARGVFHGNVSVRPGAQKTDAHQSNKNLLLSKQALVQSTPQLEIFADDVKCKHGSTTGQLDAAALFYLRSRGLDEAAARSLLTYAFASEITQRIAVVPVRAALEAFLHERLPAAPKEAVA
jgi:Fe-S cluster assembly protein SufD